MTLEYLREYRTYFHISKSYGLSESSAYKTIKWAEDMLIKHPDFSLPGKKALLKSDIEYEVFVIDTTKTPVERPKKTKKSLLWKEKTTHNITQNWPQKDSSMNMQLDRSSALKLRLISIVIGEKGSD